jgi:tetratricopeptide (TPR) repeat protein
MAKISVGQALLKAKSHAKKGEIEEAKKIYRTVLQAFPKNIRAQQELASLSKPKQNDAAQAVPREIINRLIGLCNQGHLPTVVDQAQALTEQYPEAFMVWNILGVANKGLGRTADAVSTFRRVTKLNPTYADGFNNLGVTLQDQGKLEEAIEAYDKALSIKSDYAQAYNNMGNALKDQGKLDQAIATYSKALSIKPDYCEACYNMGITLQKLGKLEEAIEAYDKALSINPNHLEAYNNKGASLQKLGKLEEAIEVCKKALTIKSDYTQAHHLMGATLKKQGKLEEAIEAYKKALTIKSDYAEAFNNMGSALREQGKLEEAIEVYNKALNIKPDYAEAARNLVKLPIGILNEKIILNLNKNFSFLCSKIQDPSKRLFFEANVLSHNGNYDDAFEVFVEANRKKLNDISISIKNRSQKYDIQIKQIQGWSPHPQAERASSVKKLFLLGPSRSGKSTLENLLMGLPNVCPMFENINLHTIKELREISMVDIFYHDENNLLKMGYNVVTSTSPATMFQIDRLLDTFSDSFCIFVKRNWIDIASQVFTTEYTKGNLYSYDHSSILEYLENYDATWEIIKQKVPHRIIEISSEDIFNKPQETVKKISQFIGARFEVDNLPDHLIAHSVFPFRQHYESRFIAP